MGTDRETLSGRERERQDAAKDWIAIDGLWFQAVEQAFGMDTAVALDCEVWEQYGRIEAERIKRRLNLPENGGLEALEAALRARLVSAINPFTIFRPGPVTLILTVTGCRVQKARDRKGMALFPCRPVGITEFSVFAAAIDSQIKTECLSCPPDTRPGVPYCQWRFSVID